MYILLWIVHVIVCLFLIIVVLLQSGKAADLAGAFGGMGSQTAFGPRGSATLLSKATTISAVLFMVTSLSLSILATRNAGLGTSVLEERAEDGSGAEGAHRSDSDSGQHAGSASRYDGTDCRSPGTARNSRHQSGSGAAGAGKK